MPRMGCSSAKTGKAKGVDIRLRLLAVQNQLGHHLAHSRGQLEAVTAEADGHIHAANPRHGVQNGVPVGHDIKKARVAAVEIAGLKAGKTMGDMAGHLNRSVIADAVVVVVGVDPVVEFNRIERADQSQVRALGARVDLADEVVKQGMPVCGLGPVV